MGAGNSPVSWVNPIITAPFDVAKGEIDKAKKAEEAARRLAAEQKAAQDKLNEELAQREQQKTADETAATGRAESRRRQRAYGSGRRSTILTDSLGLNGQPDTQRKTILGA